MDMDDFLNTLPPGYLDGAKDSFPPPDSPEVRSLMVCDLNRSIYFYLKYSLITEVCLIKSCTQTVVIFCLYEKYCNKSFFILKLSLFTNNSENK